jgi:hypothetical protein
VTSFTSHEDVARWLENKQKNVAVVLTSRAAMRVIPVFATQSAFANGPLTEAQSDIILRTFRCAATAWAFAAYPGHAAKLAHAAANAASLNDDRYGYESKEEVAASGAAAAAGSPAADVSRFASRSVMYSVLAVSDVSDQAAADILNACATDADLLERGFSAPTLALSSKLWPSVPDWAFDGWAALEHALLADHHDWEVWTDWYEARLKVGETNQAVEVARVTIPEGTWNLGAERVNVIIRRWFEERGIWRHATGPEIDHPSPSTQTETAEINSEFDLEARLTALPHEKLRVIGVRAVLRAMPLLTLSGRSPDKPEFAAACLAAFGGAARTWHASTHLPRSDISALGIAPFPDGNYEDDFGMLIAGTIVSGTYPGITPWALAGGISRMRMIAQSADGPANVTALDMALSDDMSDLNSASASAVANLPLWPGGAPPQWMLSRWIQLRRELIKVGVGWEAWVNWYEDRVRGDTRSDAWELAYVQVPEEFWADGPARVNTWIQRQIETLETTQALQDQIILTDRNFLEARNILTGGESAPPPPIPAQQPAAIEPEWRNRRLTIPKAKTKTDLTGRKFAAALKSLRHEMHGFAADISNDVNIDRRFAGYVSQLAEQIPTKVPRQDELFRLGHAESVFAGYAKVVNDEWPPILAARYHALSLNFDRTLRQSPLWREFKRNAAKDVLSFDQIQAAFVLASDVAAALRRDEADDLVDPAIPKTLVEVAEPLRPASLTNAELSKEIIEAGQQLLAYDLIESTNNILKGIFQAAIWARIADTAKDAGEAFADEALKSIVVEAKRLGKNVGPALSKWIRRLILGGVGGAAYYIAGQPFIVWLLANYPEAFKWIESAARFLLSK